MPTPDSSWQQLFDVLRHANTRIAMVVTGGGAGGLSRCFRREGASENFVEAVIPYSHQALANYLGGRPEHGSASPEMARQLSSLAMNRAVQLDDGESDHREPAGIALVAALPTKPKRRGSDRIHLALKTPQRGLAWSAELAKDGHTRESAESIADRLLYLALAKLAGLPESTEQIDDLGSTLKHEEF